LYSPYPPRDIFYTVETAQSKRELNTGSDKRNFDVTDINNDGIFRSHRVTDPLNPVYRINGEEVRGDDFGHTKAPLPAHSGPFYSLTTSDIEGAQAGSATAKYRNFRQPPQVKEEDQPYQPAPLLMTPSMKEQTAELDRQREAYRRRGERILYFENRNLHRETGGVDVPQAILRQQREGRRRIAPQTTTFV